MNHTSKPISLKPQHWECCRRCTTLLKGLVEIALVTFLLIGHTLAAPELANKASLSPPGNGGAAALPAPAAASPNPLLAPANANPLGVATNPAPTTPASL